MGLKKIEAIIRPEKLDDVKKALSKAGFPSMTVTEARGRGLQEGITSKWRGETYKVDLLPKLKIEIVTKNEDIDEILRIIKRSARTGSIGDGKIFLTPVKKAVRIRTGETGEEAI